MTRRVSALDLAATVLDAVSLTSWDEPAKTNTADTGYARDLATARERTGLDEAVLTGEARIHGRRVAVVLCEFGFLAGSVGVAAAERITAAVERATREQLPLLASPASGGTRMQEGTRAFVQMVKISAALMQHRQAGLPYLVYLRHPTTGGVFASWGALGHVTAAQPGALIGFLGPRVYEALYGDEFPDGVQTAENLLGHGLLDAVVPPEQLAGIADRALAVLTERRRGDRLPAPQDAVAADATSVWESVERSRRADRPGVRALLKHAATDVTRLRGTGEGEREPGLVLALARFGTMACLVLGQDRDDQRAGRQLGPAGLRAARRGMRLAAELDLPVVTVVDTAGAELSVQAEEGGLGAEIARCLADLVTLPVPVVCVLLGQGAGGAALAFLPSDRVLAAGHSWLAALPPEGASAIVHRTTDRARELAEAQRISSADLLADGIVDRIVPELPDAADEPDAFVTRIAATVEQELTTLADQNRDALRATRAARYRTLG
ncbi:MAG: acetyl-CoA carboxyl transferase [Streptosporangiales bacterium]|nr:acetyl-CoA carboxyl transferase [Streptosporangiales bacterium]